MNDTEQLFILAAIWALIAAYIARIVPKWSKSGRVAFFVVAVGLPFWELPYGYYNFQRLCREETRLQVLEKIMPQEIACADYPYATLHKVLLSSGFRTVETGGKTGEIRRFAARSDGGIEESIQQRLESNYCLSFQNNIRLAWRVLRHDQLITRVSDRKIAASQSRFSWLGMWWQEVLQPILGRGGECADVKNRSISALRDGTG